MKPEPLLHVTTRADWRAWLAEHHDRESEVWLVFAKRHTGLPRVEYDDAVEEALCFGWIDSLVHRLDEDRYAQKFTPRKPDSRWSDSNRRRYAKLRAAGALAPAGLARGPGEPAPAAPEHAAPARGPGASEMPAYIERALRRAPRAWKTFDRLAPSHRRLYVGWIDSAKREETRQRRLAEAIERLSQGKPLGLK
ncbi:MAG TPA: YdeI/OmpD-associated family protein [Thermoanaerobaculia bacterium]|jgi:uncharacterized protein YdeI (YjbR/CyaY-like superfamily)